MIRGSFGLSALISQEPLLWLYFTTSAAADNSAPRVRNVVLVHGAWADGSSWAKVIPLLEKAGLNAVAIQNPLTSLADDVAATKRAIARLDGSVILVGHSYGGAVISEAATTRSRGLVYVAAFAPDVGEAVGELGKEFPPAPGGAELALRAPEAFSARIGRVLANFSRTFRSSEKLRCAGRSSALREPAGIPCRAPRPPRPHPERTPLHRQGRRLSGRCRLR